MAIRQAKQIKETCNISDEQYEAILNLYKKQADETKAERDSLRKSSNGERPRMNMNGMRARQEKMNEELKKILTEEQYQKYEEMQKNRMNRRGNGGQGRGRRND